MTSDEPETIIDVEQIPADGVVPLPVPEDSSDPEELTRQATDGRDAEASNPSSVIAAVEPVVDLNPLQVDDASRPATYAVSMYPVVHRQYRTERPFDRALDSATVNTSRSLYADDYDYVWENDRRYCGSYYMPNDDDELTRLHMVHEAYLKFFDLRLTSVPLEDPKLILDIGTGTGDWAIGMAESFPDSEVVGTDIAPVQETGSVPHNVFFEVDDAEMEWTRQPDTIDLIHMRNMAGAFSNWRHIYVQCFQSLRPGGWIEVVDWDDYRLYSTFLGRFPEDAEIKKLVQAMQDASELSGRPRGVAHLNRAMLEDIGYVDVMETDHEVPMNPNETSWGKFWLLACLLGIEAGCLRLLTKHMGWDPERVRNVCRKVEDELKTAAMDPVQSNGFAMRLKTLTARKPPSDTGAPLRTEAPNHVPNHNHVAGSGVRARSRE